MNNFYLVAAAVILAMAIGTAPINLDKYRTKVCMEQIEIMMNFNDNHAGKQARAAMTLRCMGVQL